MNEQQLYKRIKRWLDKLTDAGAPLYWRKIYGNQYTRDIPDILMCVGGEFLAIELKSPEKTSMPTPKQQQEINRINAAGGCAVWTSEERAIQILVSLCLRAHGWTHELLTEPYL